MKYKKNNVNKIIGTVFTLIGLCMSLITTVVLVNHISFNRKMPETMARIEEIVVHGSGSSSSHDVYISYTAEDREYYRKLGYYSSGMYEGKTIKIHYDSSDPEKVKVESYLAEIILIPMGLVFAGVGAAVFSLGIKADKKRKYLLENGIRTIATVTDIAVDFSTTVNGRHPVSVICQIEDQFNGQIHMYQSESSFNDFSPFLGMPVNVYVDPSDHGNAYVDVASLVEEGMISGYDQKRLM